MAPMYLRVDLQPGAFEFEKIGLTGKDGEEEVYNHHAVTSVPCDGMRMKVKKMQ